MRETYEEKKLRDPDYLRKRREYVNAYNKAHRSKINAQSRERRRRKKLLENPNYIIPEVSKPVIISIQGMGVLKFGSRVQCAKKIGVTPATIGNWVKNGISRMGREIGVDWIDEGIQPSES